MRERGWIRLVGNEGSCHLFLSTHCVTPGCFMPSHPPPMSGARVLLLLSSLFFLYYIFSCVLSLSPPRHSHHSPLLLSFAFPFFFPPLPPFKRMHYFQPRLCGVDRESRTMAAFQSHDPVLERGGGEGGALAATIFFFSTVNSKQANAASLLLARLAKKTVD